jgi:predicted RNase H-like HicB family nuclease
MWYFKFKITTLNGGMMKLHVVIEQDEAGYFTAEVPALPGCLSQGKTREEAIANIKEAIAGWLEVMESKFSFDPSNAIEVAV